MYRRVFKLAGKVQLNTVLDKTWSHTATGYECPSRFGGMRVSFAPRMTEAQLLTLHYSCFRQEVAHNDPQYIPRSPHSIIWAVFALDFTSLILPGDVHFDRYGFRAWLLVRLRYSARMCALMCRLSTSKRFRLNTILESARCLKLYRARISCGIVVQLHLHAGLSLQVGP